MSAPVIRYGFHPTPYGEGLIATTAHGICRLTFVAGGKRATVARLKAEFPEATCVEDAAGTRALMRQAFDPARNRALALDLTGTAFQRRVWSELLQIPRGATTTYGGLAARIGAPTASRAVGSAVGANPVCFVVPVPSRRARRRHPRGLRVGARDEGRDARRGAGAHAACA